MPTPPPSSLREVEALARTHTRRAVEVMESIMEDEAVRPNVRLAAATELLNRAWGKARQVIRSEDPTRDLSDRELDDLINRRVAAITGVALITHDPQDETAE